MLVSGIADATREIGARVSSVLLVWQLRNSRVSVLPSAVRRGMDWVCYRG